MSNIDFSQLVTAEQKVEAARAAAHAALGALRWRRETGGLDLPGGMRLPSSRESQAQLQAALSALRNGVLAAPVSWKLESGWADLSDTEIEAMARAMTDHVTRCFAAERAVATQMAALTGDLSDFDIGAAFDAAMEAKG